MATVLLVVHILIVLALIGLVLMQKSEGGALGMGGGGGGAGGFLTGRGTANLLTRTTAILAICFFATSILSTILANRDGSGGSVFDSVTTTPAATDGAAGATEDKAPSDGDGGSGGGILDDLERGRGPLPSVPGGR